MNPYGGPDDEAPDVAPAATPPARRRARTMGVIAVVLLAVTAASAVSIAISMHRLIIEQKRETCYDRLAWLNGASDFDSIMPENNTLDARADAAKRCDGDNPLTQYDKR